MHDGKQDYGCDEQESQEQEGTHQSSHRATALTVIIQRMVCISKQANFGCKPLVPRYFHNKSASGQPRKNRWLPGFCNNGLYIKEGQFILQPLWYQHFAHEKAARPTPEKTGVTFRLP
jgi:hypothetical protein